MSLWSEICEPRFEPELNSGCWLWFGDTNAQGYGQVSVGPPYKKLKAHRVSYEHHKGEIPQGLQVCHRCDTRACVNPEHLWLGSNHENTRDNVEKNRDAKKLNPDLVLDIYRMTGTQQQIADAFGIRQTTVGRIKSGYSWGHITGKGKKPRTFKSRDGLRKYTR